MPTIKLLPIRGSLTKEKGTNPMLPEYALSAMIAALLGWGGFTWRRAENAIMEARSASDKTDRLELKVAEHYLTKKEFEMSMDRLFSTLARFEEKLDYHVYEQDQTIKRMKDHIRDKKDGNLF
jgi:hypothetical protein